MEGKEPAKVRTLHLLRRPYLFLHFERLAGVNDVNDRAGSRCLEVLQECARVPAIRVGRVYALGREVIEFLEIRIPSFIIVEMYKHTRGEEEWG